MGRPRKDVPSASVTLRFELKNKYLAELAAQESEMSLNRFVEQAVEKALQNGKGEYHDESLWHEDHLTRVQLRVESGRPLSIDDTFLLDAIKEHEPLFSRGKVNWKAVRPDWDLLLAMAAERKSAMIADFKARLKIRSVDR